MAVPTTLPARGGLTGSGTNRGRQISSREA